jgi:RNA polymerase subunit RPABC4/transcription elongation factor Spt4
MDVLSIFRCPVYNRAGYIKTGFIRKGKLYMFLIFGIDRGQKRLDFDQTVICPFCGKFGRLEVFAAYMCFSLFFIPLFKWRKEYYANSSCCGTAYAIPKELGRSIEKGECSALKLEDLRILSNGGRKRICAACGYETEDENFRFCPVCGSKLN